MPHHPVARGRGTGICCLRLARARLRVAGLAAGARRRAAATRSSSPPCCTSRQPAGSHPRQLPNCVGLLEGAASAGAGSLINASGKWVPVDIEGPGAARLLASTLDIEAVLSNRDCAAVTLFDCPAVVARVTQGFRLWVQASYAAHLLATAAY